MVTGSHIRRVDLETDNPVVAVTAQQIQATGALTLGDVIQRLPVITGGLQNPSINNAGGSGSTLVGLRGLGFSRTLILVDGERINNKDLNTIPTVAVERVEVLTSGASAIYGSDAIGGVINFILKSNYQGAQFTANYGISDHDDGARRGGSFMFGQTSDKGSILAGVSYNKFDSILQANRPFAASVQTVTTSGGHLIYPIVAATSYNLRDTVYVGDALNAQFGCSTPGQTLSLNQDVFNSGKSPTGPGDYHCLTAADAYNFAAVNYIYTPNERTNAFLKGVYHLSDNVDFYATLYHNKTSSSAQLAPAVFGVPTTGVLTVSKDNYYNPFHVDFSPSGADLHLRMLPIGPRVFSNGNTTDQLMTGFRGNVNLFGQNWQWDVGYNYGHTSTINAAINFPNQTAILQGIANPSMLDPATGQVVCVSQAGNLNTIIDGCTPWDPFNLNSPSAKAVLGSASSAAPGLVDTWTIQRVYHAGISGGLFDLPAGTTQLAAGVAYQKLYTNNVVGQSLLLDPTTASCQLGSACSAHLQGGYTVKEAYAELYLPLLKDLPFINGLNLTLSDRFSKYSDFGSTNNWKVGLEWRPIQDLLLRGTVASVFRAPTIGNIFGAPVSSAPFLGHDPCDGITAANPACVGVPTDGSFVNNAEQFRSDGSKNPQAQQLSALTSGSQAAGFPLGPEQGKSFDFGVVYSPHFVPGLSASVDFWRIYLNDTITPGVGVQTVLDQCFAGVLTYCPLITRAQSGVNAGQLIKVIQPTANLGRFDVKGVDLAANYRLPQFSFGQFNIGLQATYMQQVKINSAPGSTTPAYSVAGVMGWFGSDLANVCPSAGGMCFYPRVRGQVSVDWQLGPWSAGWRMQGTSPFEMYGAPDAQKDVENLWRYGTYIYNDLNVGYNIEPINTMVQVGINNVFDKQPPFLGGFRSLNSNTDPEDFDTIGRYYWARVTVKF
ncbi:MAG TPA: TonB-dependent receptor [Rhodanobacteraceae bacterium]|nr:TonB-dependent receptor [Rhodanobacteraceae bacterium]